MYSTGGQDYPRIGDNLVWAAIEQVYPGEVIALISSSVHIDVSRSEFVLYPFVDIMAISGQDIHFASGLHEVILGRGVTWSALDDSIFDTVGIFNLH